MATEQAVAAAAEKLQKHYDQQKRRFLIDVSQYGGGGVVISLPSSSSSSLVTLRRSPTRNFAWTCSVDFALAAVGEQRRVSTLLTLVFMQTSAQMVYESRELCTHGVQLTLHASTSGRRATLRFVPTPSREWRPFTTCSASASFACNTATAVLTHVKNALRNDAPRVDETTIRLAREAFDRNEPNAIGYYSTYHDMCDAARLLVTFVAQFEDAFDSCMHCEAPRAPMRCSCCLAVLYCDETCQHADWPTHKHACRAVASLVAAVERFLLDDAPSSSSPPPRPIMLDASDVEACDAMFKRVETRVIGVSIA